LRLILKNNDNMEFRRAAWEECTKILIDALYSARGHQAAAHRWATVTTFLGIPTAVVTALAAGGASVAAIAGGNPGATAALALLAAALSAIRAVLRPEATLQEYQNKGAGYLALRNDVAFFRDVVLRTKRCSEEDVESQLHSFVARRNTLNSQLPIRIPGWAYRIAKLGIDAGESSYEDDPLWIAPPF
jgi:hypothetical protein